MPRGERSRKSTENWEWSFFSALLKRWNVKFSVLIGYWLHEGQGKPIWETGWSVLPEVQGQGVAQAGVQALLKQLRTMPDVPTLHAWPNAQNVASNRLCRALGFSLLTEVQFEDPEGHLTPCNDWIIRLQS
ncbi:GNAT family N-acetyltransferase [Deinococcus sp.]|uniref:GNAT family N-acetyltransferase n=1 Tax=Deinococcus sp. TaxID=47478 RepID=UPI003C7A46BC